MNSKTRKAMELYRKDLLKIKKRIEGKCSTELNKANEKIAKIKDEYKTIQDVEEAYGCGCISSKKKDEYINMLNNAAGKEQSANDIYLELINRNIRDITLELKMEE